MHKNKEAFEVIVTVLIKKQKFNSINNLSLL